MLREKVENLKVIGDALVSLTTPYAVDLIDVYGDGVKWYVFRHNGHVLYLSDSPENLLAFAERRDWRRAYNHPPVPVFGYWGLKWSGAGGSSLWDTPLGYGIRTANPHWFWLTSPNTGGLRTQIIVPRQRLSRPIHNQMRVREVEHFRQRGDWAEWYSKYQVGGIYHIYSHKKPQVAHAVTVQITKIATCRVRDLLCGQYWREGYLTKHQFTSAWSDPRLKWINGSCKDGKQVWVLTCHRVYTGRPPHQKGKTRTYYQPPVGQLAFPGDGWEQSPPGLYKPVLAQKAYSHRSLVKRPQNAAR